MRCCVDGCEGGDIRGGGEYMIVLEGCMILRVSKGVRRLMEEDFYEVEGSVEK